MIEAKGELIVDQPQTAATINPMQMIAQAVAQGADVDKLAKLMDLQERWSREEARKAYIDALGRFKANPPKIGKNKAVDFQTSKGRTHYRHATLDNVCDLIGAALADVGISYRWRTEQLDNGLIKVGCILTHTLGHSEETWLQAGKDESGNKNSIQAVGSTVTYLQRYTLLAATGMAVSDQDDDGRQGKKGLEDSQVEAFQDAIQSVADEDNAGRLWQQIAQACTAAGDVENYEFLRAEMTAKRRALKEAPQL